MARVAPFYSRVVTAVHHVSDKCAEGRHIKRKDRVEGTGGRRMCETCKDLVAGGRC